MQVNFALQWHPLLNRQPYASERGLHIFREGMWGGNPILRSIPPGRSGEESRMSMACRRARIISLRRSNRKTYQGGLRPWWPWYFWSTRSHRVGWERFVSSKSSARLTTLSNCSGSEVSPVNTKILNLVSEGSRSWISMGLLSTAQRDMSGISRWPTGRPNVAYWYIWGNWRGSVVHTYAWWE